MSLHLNFMTVELIGNASNYGKKFLEIKRNGVNCLLLANIFFAFISSYFFG